MGLFDSLQISSSALATERVRMDVTAENLANQQTTRTAAGGPYQRKQVVVQQAAPEKDFATELRNAAGVGAKNKVSGVEVAGIVADQTPPRQKYDPSNPDADARGYVTLPNIDPVTEMVDLISSSRAYEANLTAMQTAKQMFTKTLELLR